MYVCLFICILHVVCYSILNNILFFLKFIIVIRYLFVNLPIYCFAKLRLLSNFLTYVLNLYPNLEKYLPIYSTYLGLVAKLKFLSKKSYGVCRYTQCVLHICDIIYH